MKLNELAKTIEAWTQNSECPLEEAYVYSKLTRPLVQLESERNKILDAGTESNGFWIQRRSMLNHSIEIEGDFHLVDYSPHDPYLTIWTYDSKEELEEHLTSDSGPLNPFIEYGIPFIRGEAFHYSLHFVAEGKKEEFQFGEELRKIRDFELKASNPRIEWKNKAEPDASDNVG